MFSQKFLYSKNKVFTDIVIVFNLSEIKYKIIFFGLMISVAIIFVNFNDESFSIEFLIGVNSYKIFINKLKY